MSEKSITPDSNKKLCCITNPFARNLCKDCYANAIGKEVGKAVEALEKVLLAIKT